MIMADGVCSIKHLQQHTHKTRTQFIHRFNQNVAYHVGRHNAAATTYCPSHCIPFHLFSIYLFDFIRIKARR